MSTVRNHSNSRPRRNRIGPKRYANTRTTTRVMLKLINHLVCSNEVDQAYDLLKRYPDNKPDGNTLWCAIMIGDLDLVKDLVGNQGLRLNEDDKFEDLIGFITVPVLEYLLSRFESPGPILEAAMSVGSLEVLKYLLKFYRYTPDSHDLALVLRSGRMDVIDYFLNNYQFKASQEALKAAISTGSLELVHRLLKDNRLVIDSDCINEAARSGSLEMFTYILDISEVGSDTTVLSHAIKAGSLDIIKYLAKRYKFKITKDDFVNALRHPSAELFIYLDENYYLDTYVNGYKGVADDMVMSFSIEKVDYMLEHYRVLFTRNSILLAGKRDGSLLIHILEKYKVAPSEINLVRLLVVGAYDLFRRLIVKYPIPDKDLSGFLSTLIEYNNPEALEVLFEIYPDLVDNYKTVQQLEKDLKDGSATIETIMTLYKLTEYSPLFEDLEDKDVVDYLRRSRSYGKKSARKVVR